VNTIESLIEEVEDSVELYYDESETDLVDIPRMAVEEVLYSISLPQSIINQYWDKLMQVAVEKCDTLTEHENF